MTIFFRERVVSLKFGANGNGRHWATFRILETVIIMGSGTGFELLLQ